MAKRKYYHMDRQRIIETNNRLMELYGGFRREQKNDNWSPGQQAELHLLTYQVLSLLSLVDHLNEIVQNDGE